MDEQKPPEMHCPCGKYYCHHHSKEVDQKTSWMSSPVTRPNHSKDLMGFLLNLAPVVMIAALFLLIYLATRPPS